MTQYKIVTLKYTEAGALTNEKGVYYYDSVEQAERAYDEWNSQKYVNEDGTPGFKMYKVNLYTAAYKCIEDVQAFFDNFKA